MASIEISQLFTVQDLVAVVTGGGSGIGLMMAQALEANGATVYIFGRRRETLEKAASTAKHANIFPIVGDVTSKADLERAAAEVEAAHGHVDIVIANAGIGGPGMVELPANATLDQFRQHISTWTAEAFTQTFAVNTTAVFNTAAAFLGLLDAANKRNGNRAPSPKKSQIVAVSSISAFYRQPVHGYAYSASKAAVVHMMKQLATSLVPYGIRANVIAPGLYPSELTVGALDAYKDGWPKTLIPEERPGELQDMAGAILFLASRAGAYINGNVLVTDGGRLSVLPASY
ncbi:short chain dehydrogenase reductase [Grosmannia clavigera kw1407]|uniref:Short chain dehydrogenase reductase n=1 Tax=Grosmannia clavigera (strain kw1407 / UAMH 11150) TaxID=655863 RepID=F0XET0_GROCL|nr:short chain dehydrogenase reductase [Grosmannia clavigera kw1407]EFX04763.1 short chain dehydrogenase reductase [Grosmannia clavigera kw1407]